MKGPGCAGLVEQHEGLRLNLLASSVLRDYRIVEIGTHTGLSTLWMATSAKAHIVAIDPWGDPRPESLDDPFGLGTGDRVFEQYVMNVSRERAGDGITALRATSTEVARIWTHAVGLLFIDAVHIYENVKEDFQAWDRFLIPGGWATFHDYNPWPEHPYYGVAVAVDELCADYTDVMVTGSLWTGRKPMR